MKTLKVGLLVALIFLAGFVGGVVATRITVRQFVRNAVQNPEVFRDRIERDLIHRLKLDPQQRMRARQILMRSHERLRFLRQEFQPRFADIMRDARGEIAGLLTPEQRKQFEEFQNENRRFLPPPR